MILKYYEQLIGVLKFNLTEKKMLFSLKYTTLSYKVETEESIDFYGINGIYRTY